MLNLSLFPFKLPRRWLRLLMAIALMAILLLLSRQVLAQQWLPVRGGITFGISGIALIQQQNDRLDLLVVHDNKEKRQERLAILKILAKNQPEYFPLKWPNDQDLPRDLEGLSAIPWRNNSEFIALSSSGIIYHIKLDLPHQILSIIKTFRLPDIPKDSNFEGLALQKIDEKLLITWADRGEGKKPATIYWGTIDLANYKIEPKGSSQLKVPFPRGDVRHVSDLKIDRAGVLFITAATDPGNDGPYQSAVYVAGAFWVCEDAIAFRKNPDLVPLFHYDYHKIEAIELIPGAEGFVLVGTDDENMGSSVYLP